MMKGGASTEAGSSEVTSQMGHTGNSHKRHTGGLFPRRENSVVFPSFLGQSFVYNSMRVETFPDG